MIKVSIVDDHTMVLQGIQTMLQNESNIQVIGAYDKAVHFFDDVNKNEPTILLLDINLPDGNGIELCKEIGLKYPDIVIIALSNYSEPGFIKNMLRNGAKGYLLKNTEKDELILALKEVYAGNTYLPRAVQQILLAESIGSPTQTRFVPKLTRREKEVLNLIANEHTSQEIAEKLCVSPKTVEAHRNNLIQKMGARNTAGLIKSAMEKGLI
ncbi:response regulator transcription factor [Spongiivirga sp. MCCC 1A20706]|uniref:response regulator n=1 Tax=Spongiivirga sp. MCCC 1A20706 TaxID=3160963 RepID=UPI00397733ED